MVKKAKDYFGNFMKIFLLACFTVVDVISPVTSVFASTNETNPYQKGDVVKSSVTEGSLTNPGDVQVVKTLTKTDVEGRYNINFTIKGKKNINTTNYKIYATLVFDKSGSMICDSNRKSYAYKTPVGHSSTSYTAKDGETIYCSNSSYWDNKVLSDKWEKAVSGGVNFSSTITNNLNSNPANPKAKLSLVTFATNVSSASDWQTTAYTESQFGHPIGSTNLAYAINVAQNKLAGADNDNTSLDPIKKVMVIISDGEPDSISEAKSAAKQARDAGTIIYTIGYNTSNSAKEVLKNIAGDESRYVEADETSVSQKMQELASKVSESDAGINAILTDTLNTNDFDYVSGDAGVNYSDGKITYDVGNITPEGTSFNFIVDIKGDTANGIVDTNDGFTLNYENNGPKEVSTKENPSVYWEQNKYSYNVEYYYDDEIDTDKGYPVTDVIAGTKTTYIDKPKEGYVLKEVINSDKEVRDNTIVVQVKYEKIRNLSYKVEYYYDGQHDIANDYSVNDVEYGSTTTYIDKTKEGYRLKNVTGNNEVVKNNDNVVKVYYETINDLSYKVEYYFDGKHDTSKDYTEKDVVYGTETTYKDIDHTGYYEESVVNAGVKVVDNTIIVKVYYKTINDLSYKVEYYYDGVHDTSKDYPVNNVVYGTKTTYVSKNKTGYKLSKVENNDTAVKDNSITVRVYYVKDQFSYTVKYYYDEILDDAATETDTATYEDVINSYKDKTKEGYRLDRTENLPLTISEISENNLINVYYKLIDDLSYKVEYYYDGEHDTSKDYTEENVVYGSTTTYIDKAIEGYRLKTVTGNNEVVKNSNNVVRVYYETINDLSYKVEYYFDGEHDTSKDYTEENVVYGTLTTYREIGHTGYYKVKEESTGVKVVDDTITVRIYYETINDLSYKVEYYFDGKHDTSKDYTVNNVVYGTLTTYNEIDHTGYYKVNEENTGIEVVDNTITVRVYYEKIKDLSYKVEYYFDGEHDTSKDYTEENVVYGSITTYKEIDHTGYYKVNEENTGIEVVDNTITVRVYYETISDLSYNVEYYYDGVHDTSKDYTVNNVVYGTKTTYINKNKTGYKFSRVENNNVTVKDNTITVRVYYVKDQFSYTVKYYYDEILDDAATETDTATYEDVINSYKDKTKEGYRLDRTENLPLTISEISENNLINVYYKLIDDLSYKVEYYYDGEHDTSKDYTEENVVYGSTTTYIDKAIEGYRFKTVTGNNEVVKNNNNVVRVYYETINDLSYKVEYYYDNILDDSKTYTESDVIYGTLTTYIDKNVTGYKLDKVINSGEKVINNDLVVKVYYVKDTFKFRVEYYYEDINTSGYTIDKSLTEYGEAEYKSEISDYTDNTKYGYEFNSTSKLPLIISEKEEENVIKVYYSRLNSNVIVIMEDEDGNKLKDVFTVTGKVQDDYNIETPEIPDYSLVKIEGDVQGEFTEEDIIVKFIYKKIIHEVAPNTGLSNHANIFTIVLGLIGSLMLIIRRKREA